MIAEENLNLQERVMSAENGKCVVKYKTFS